MPRRDAARGPLLRRGRAAAVLALAACTAAADPGPPTASREALAGEAFAAADRLFDDYRLDAHAPGLVYGIVADGRLVHVRGFGVQELDARRPVTPDTLFRIASMTKAFTALTVLKLRDDGRLRLDAPAEEYVPELRGWQYPTADSPRIRVRDLLNHVAGFVTDDPWGDRQTPLPEAEFTKLLREGVPFTRAPDEQYEYSNLGYALLGRIVGNVSRAPYAETITRTLLEPLGMTASGFVAEAAPRERRALGYRWEDDAWRPEPVLGPGAFGAMGGLQTSAVDYAKWVAFLLSAWPPRDDPEAGPVRRATVRELAQGSNFPRSRARFGHAAECRQAVTYGMGMQVALDCDLGLTLSHSGGYPGFGSHVLLLPEYGVGIFAFANRTYSAPTSPVWDAALELKRRGWLARRAPAVSPALASAYGAAAAIWAAGEVTGAGDVLAMNVLLDRSAEAWKRDLAALRATVGECETASPIAPSGALAGEFTWRCQRGRVKGTLLLAPTRPPRIQSLTLERTAP
jgi:CubicO group peptidase (beta-lactamase class C family)